MWTRLSVWIIKFRLGLLIATALITAFMAYESQKVEMTYDFVKVVPETDEDLIYFKRFKKTFGEDDNVLVIGMQDSSVFLKENFVKYQNYTRQLGDLKGITQVISIPTMKFLSKDTAEKKFVLKNIINRNVQSQAELDSLLNKANNNKFYDRLIYNDSTKATLVALTIDKHVLNSPLRQQLIEDVFAMSEQFSKSSGIKLHYAGLPYVRSIMVKKVSAELKFLSVMAALVTCLILFFFFRSYLSVVFTFLVIVITVIWTLGTIVLLGYKMTLLTGMLPALIIVIGIPNCVYMYNKYHQEFKRHRNKVKAVSRIVEKIGFLTFMTNTNTAVGFFVLFFTDIVIIKEFGMVAGILSLATFVITMAVIPPLLMYLPEPNVKQLKHLDFGMIAKARIYLERIVITYRKTVYITTAVLLLIAIVGIFKIKSVSYMVDDLPTRSPVKTDLVFFEQNFNGVMPLEIVVDLGKKKGIYKQANLQLLEKFDEFLRAQPELSPPISIVNLIKGSTQAFYNDTPENYRIPSSNERPFILKYLNDKGDNKNLIRTLVDSTGQYVRFTCKMADIGTNKMSAFIDSTIQPKVKELFDGKEIKAKVTGTTLLFLKGNQYLIDDLTGSLIFAFFLISLMMAMLFTNVRMIIISVIPNVIPMLLTAGIMGWFGIILKPSTALIFSISFGISIDSTIHYLSKYKQDFKLNRGNILEAVKSSLHETSISMIYTSIVLLCGFIIFAFSDFGGTVALGVLTSITLFFAMITNLVLLPCLLISFGKKK
jgi:predicted RND superfamily exporter protein